MFCLPVGGVGSIVSLRFFPEILCKTRESGQVIVARRDLWSPRSQARDLGHPAAVSGGILSSIGKQNGNPG